MTKVKTLIHVLTHSLLPQSKYYKTVLKTPISFSIKYLMTLIFILNMSAIFVFAFLHKDSLYQIYTSKNEPTKILQEFPNDLHILIDNEMMKTTLERPYFVWQTIDNVPHPLIVIDERSMTTDVEKYHALVLVASDGIVFSIDKTSYQFRYLPHETFSFDKTAADSLKNQLAVIMNLSPLIILLTLLGLFILLPLLSALSALLILLFISLAVFAGIKLIHRRITLRSVFHIALHSSTLPLLIQYAFFAFGLQMVLPMGFTIIYLLFLTLSIYEVYGKN